MNLFVPRIGTVFTLVDPWEFDLYNEDRNASLMHYLNDPRATGSRWCDHTAQRHILPVGTKLKVDRIYIRKGQDEFDSMTFTMPDVRVALPLVDYANNPTGKVRKMVPRFWVKLDCANKILFNEHTMEIPE